MSVSSNFDVFGKFPVRGINSKLYFSVFAFCLLFLNVSVNAQEEEIPANLAPPPIKMLSKDEKAALSGSEDVKIRTKLIITLMDTRLKKAEELNTGESFPGMLDELGGFQALMDDALKYINRNDNGGGKVMDTYKKFEMALRGFTPRIEVIRRDSPDRYEYYVRRLLRTVRDVRSKAVENFFTSNIVPN